MKTVAWCAFTGILAATAAVQGVHRESWSGRHQPGSAGGRHTSSRWTARRLAGCAWMRKAAWPSSVPIIARPPSRSMGGIGSRSTRSRFPSRRRALTIANDVWLTGVLRVGRADAFGDAPFRSKTARFRWGAICRWPSRWRCSAPLRKGEERWRLGATAEGDGLLERRRARRPAHDLSRLARGRARQRGA
jgi:hypothetical protein